MDLNFIKSEAVMNAVHILSKEYSGGDCRGRVFRASQFPVRSKAWSHGLKVILTGRTKTGFSMRQKVSLTYSTKNKAQCLIQRKCLSLMYISEVDQFLTPNSLNCSLNSRLYVDSLLISFEAKIFL